MHEDESPLNILSEETTSIPKSDLGGDLYSDNRISPQLNSRAQSQFNICVNRLNQFSDIVRSSHQGNDLTKWELWEQGIRAFYKELVFNAFEDLQIKIPEGMEIYFAGSLAKSQATEFSDLDAFVILKEKEDREKVLPAFKALNNLCQRIFATNAQLYPDPIGINPERLMGTVDELYAQLTDDDIFDAEPIISSILTSKPILGNFEYGEKLRTKIRENEQFKHLVSAEKFYNTAIKDFQAPNPEVTTINIKTHIMRPLDFILMGLREQYKLYIEDGSHLSASKTIQMLRKENCIPEEQISLIESIYNGAMAKRFKLHNVAQKEQDIIPPASVEHMLENIQKLRDFANNQVQTLKAEQLQKPQEKSILDRVDAFNTKIGVKMVKVTGLPNKAKQAIKNWMDPKNITENADEENPGLSRGYKSSITALAKLGRRVVPDCTVTSTLVSTKVSQTQQPERSQAQKSELDTDDEVLLRM